MAKVRNSDQKNPNKVNLQKNSSNDKKMPGIILPLISILVVVLAIIGGTFYILIHNNINNLAEKYRSVLQDKPALAWMLPAPLNPEDPWYMPANEVRKKYEELVKENQNLKTQLEESQKKVEELQNYKNEAEAGMSEFEKKKAQLEKDIADFQTKVAQEDDTGFRDFYEEINPEKAAELYAGIVKRQEASKELEKIAGIYAEMDVGSAASILNEMGSEKIDLIVSILSFMDTKDAAGIIALLDRNLASLITESMYTVVQE
ncbi:MAG TPA: hypothetical protein GXX49_08965 [Clostridiaceae bacterium]|nr:hypothetical protein [Clostridiaceae bacterium]